MEYESLNSEERVHKEGGLGCEPKLGESGLCMGQGGSSDGRAVTYRKGD